MKPKIAIVRGAFLNQYEMQFYEPLINDFDITAFGSQTSFHHQFAFPTKTLWSPMDLPNVPVKLPILNRLLVDSHYLLGLERELAGVDLVHTAETYYHYTHQALNAKRKGKVKKVIATVLENIPFNNEGIRGRKRFKETARNQLDHIIALTERTKTALLLEGANPEKITVIPHFIDTKRFQPRTSSSINQNLTILFCGRLETYKGVFDLLWAIALLKRDKEIKQQIKLRMVGDGSQKQAIIQMAKRLGIEDMIELQTANYETMPKFYQQADIYAAPSKSSGTWIEQYNTTLLEAQAAGLPIVTTLSGGIPENVGDAALLVPPDDVYALTQAIKDFVLHPTKRVEFGKKARQRAVTFHDIQIGASKIRSVWHQVLSNQQD